MGAKMTCASCRHFGWDDSRDVLGTCWWGSKPPLSAPGDPVPFWVDLRGWLESARFVRGDHVGCSAWEQKG